MRRPRPIQRPVDGGDFLLQFRPARKERILLLQKVSQVLVHVTDPPLGHCIVLLEPLGHDLAEEARLVRHALLSDTPHPFRHSPGSIESEMFLVFRSHEERDNLSASALQGK